MIYSLKILAKFFLAVGISSKPSQKDQEQTKREVSENQLFFHFYLSKIKRFITNKMNSICRVFYIYIRTIITIACG